MDISSESYERLSNDLTVITTALVDWLKAQKDCSRVYSFLWDDTSISQTHESLSRKACKEREELAILSRVTDGSLKNTGKAWYLSISIRTV